MHRLTLLTGIVCLISQSFADAQAEVGEAVLRGVVTNERGEPVAGAKVTLNNYQDARLDPQFPEPTVTNDGGEYRLPLGVQEGRPVTLREVWAEKPGYVRAETDPNAALDVGGVADVDFKLAPGLILAGRVDGPEDPLRSRTPRLLKVTDAAGRQTHRLTDESGRFEMYLPEGVYSISTHGPIVRGRTTELRANGVRAGQRDVVVGPVDKTHNTEPVSPEKLGTAFDALWEAMDGGYSYFPIKTGVDWADWREKHRPAAASAESVDAFVEVLRGALAELRDPHIVIETPDGAVGTFGLPFRGNWNPRVGAKTYVDPIACGQFALVGRTRPDGFGYVVITAKEQRRLKACSRPSRRSANTPTLPGSWSTCGAGRPAAPSRSPSWWPASSATARRSTPSTSTVAAKDTTISERSTSGGSSPANNLTWGPSFA